MGPRSHINTKPKNNTLFTLKKNIQNTDNASPFSVVIYY